MNTNWTEVQVIKYPCCGKVFAACAVPHCYQEKEWMEELSEYSKKGCVIEIKPVGEYKFEKCTCSEAPEVPIDPNQLELFETKN